MHSLKERIENREVYILVAHSSRLISFGQWPLDSARGAKFKYRESQRNLNFLIKISYYCPWENVYNYRKLFSRILFRLPYPLIIYIAPTVSSLLFFPSYAFSCGNPRPLWHVSRVIDYRSDANPLALDSRRYIQSHFKDGLVAQKMIRIRFIFQKNV